MTHVERTPDTDVGEIWLDGFPYRISGPIESELSNLYARKVNQGDPGPDDHPTFSTSIQRDWSRGLLVNKMNPASDQARSWWSTMETQYPGVLALGPFTFTYDAPVGADPLYTPWVLGDWTDRMHLAWGPKVYAYNAVTDAFAPVGDAPAIVTGEGCVYRETSDSSPKALYLFVPHLTGYCTISEAGVIDNGTDTQRVVDIEVWDDKVWKLMEDGTLWWANKKALAAVDWTLSTRIPDGTTPRRLLSYMTRNNEPCLFVVTDATTWKHDFANNLLHKDDLWFPRHYSQGRAAIVHRADAMISVGVGVFRYDNNTISAYGLDDRNGLPIEFRGFIVDFENAYNGMYALLEGARSNELLGTETSTLNVGGADHPFYALPHQTNNLLMVHNGFGWHYRWHGEGSPPTNVLSSQAQNTYTIWWGSGGRLYKQFLAQPYFNPGDPESRGYPFALHGEHETPWNEWGWLGQDKIMKQIEVEVKNLDLAGGFIDVFYKMDRDDNPYVLLDRIETDGEFRFYVGQDIHEPVLRNGNLHVKGVRHQRYRLKFVMERDPRNEEPYWNRSPQIEWHAAVARRWLRPQRYWRVNLDMTRDVKDHPMAEQLEHLNQMATKQEAVIFQHQDQQYMVEVIVHRGPEMTGRDRGSKKTVTLLEANDLGPEGRP